MVIKIIKEETKDKLLTITSKMSGYRIDTDEDIDDIGYLISYKDFPEVVKQSYWYLIKGISIEFDGGDTTIGGGLEYVTK